MLVNRRRRRTLLVGGALAALITTYTLVYSWGMGALEGRPRTLVESLGVVIETMTTTGYGGDAPWSHPFMIVLSILMQASGIVGIFALVNVLAEDRIRRALQAPPPKKVQSSMNGHAVICEAEEYATFLADELSALNHEYVIVSNDAERVRELRRNGYQAIFGDPETEQALRNARAHAASHIIIDIGDRRNTSAILAAEREVNDARIIALAKEERLRPYYQYAGSDVVLSPRELIGRALADKASTGVKYDIDNDAKLGDDLQIREVTMPPASPLVGKTIRNAEVERNTGVAIVGAWLDGLLQLPPEPDATLAEDAVLVVAGSEEDIDKLRRYVRPPQIPVTHDEVIVGGHGETGTAAEAYLEKNGVNVTTVDSDLDSNPDIVGDIDDRDVLEEAGIEDAGAYVIAVSSDPSALLSILIARRIRGEDLEIAAATTENDVVRKTLQAGADYAVARPRVAGRLITREIEGKSSLDPTSHIRIAQVDAPKLGGKTLRGAQVRRETGVTVVAIRRDGSLISPVDPTTTLRTDDTFVVVGTDDSVREFRTMFSGNSS